MIIINSRILQLFLFFFLTFQIGYSQVDLVYTDLVWSDEFDVNGSVNSNNWFHQTQLPDGVSWFSGELQHYTDRIENSFVDAGMLNIVAKSEVYTDQGVTMRILQFRILTL